MKKVVALFVFAVFFTPAYVFGAQWFDNDWQYRIKLTTNPAQTSGTLNNYISYVDLSVLPTDFFSHVDEDGQDIVVTSDDGVTRLIRDLVAVDTLAQTGEIHVTIPTITSATGTDIYLYYGNASTTEANESFSVWQDYRGVWHLGEDGVASSSVQYDLGITTQQAMDGGDGAWAVLFGPDPVGTFIDLAIDEDQVIDNERNHTTEQVGYWAFGASGAFDIQNSGNVIIGEAGREIGVSSASTSVTFRNTYTNPVVTAVHNMQSGSDNPAVVRVTDVTSTGFSVYLQNPSGDSVTPAPVYFVVVEEGLHTLPGGTIMEAGIETITGVNRSGRWNSSEMVKVNTMGTFTDPVVFGQVVTDNEPLWQTFWSSNGTQTGPATASSLYVGRHTAQDTNVTRAADDVAYIVIDQGVGVMGSVPYIAAITADVVRGVTDSPPYSFDIASGAGADAGVTPGVFKDSTINGFDGGLTSGIATDQDSIIGRGLSMNGFVGTYIPIENLSYNSTNGLSELTASFWLNTTQTTRSGILDFDRSDHWQIGLNFHNASGAAGQISFDTANSANGIRDLNSGVVVNDGTWHYITAVFDSSSVAETMIYVDGVLAVSADQHTAGLGKPTTRFGFIGDGSEASSYDAGRNNLPQAGLFDEVRITHNVLPANEILTTYNNQNDPATFFIVGPQEERNLAPLQPSVLFANHTDAQSGDTNPNDLALYTPVHFSSVYEDDDTGDMANQARIQVSTDPTFAVISHWDSGTTTITDVTESNRSVDIVYDAFGMSASSSIVMDDGVVNYYWRILFVDDGGLAGEWSDIATFSILDIPTAPSGLGVLKTASDEFTLSWSDNSTNEDVFIIERKDDTGTGFGSWTQIATTTTPTYDDNPPLNAAYMYRVAAQNYAGASAFVADPVIHYTDPAAPIEVYGEYISATEFSVHWNDQAPVVLTDSVEHCVGETNCLADTFVQIGGGLQTSTSSPISDTAGIVADEQYRWKVRADNGVATSQYTYSPYEYTAPAAPGSPTAQYVSDSIISITWSDNSSFEDGFRIWVSQNEGVFTELTPGVNTVGANMTSYIFSDVQPGSTYQFEVHAHVPATIYNPELSGVATTTPVYTSPEAPTDVSTVYNADNDIDVTWSDNSSFEDGFRIWVSQNGGAFLLAGTTTQDVDSFVYTQGVSDGEYKFIAESVINANSPTNPQELSASSTESELVYTKPNTPTLTIDTIGSVGIDWGVSESATYEVGFQLQESDATTVRQDIPLANISTISETGLSPNTLVERVLRAYVENNGSKLYSDPSGTVSVYTAANTPFVSSTTVMEATGDSITWVWQEESNPASTEYFAQNITTGATFGWEDTPMWQETGLACESTYDFEVKARNQNGVETGVATSTQSTLSCAPTVELPVVNQTVASSTNVVGTCTDGATVVISGDKLDPNPVTATCSGGTYVIPITFASSTIGATSIDVAQVVAPFATSTPQNIPVIVDPSAGQDSDGDGISDALEDAGFNSGDGDGDGILDSTQPQVSAAPNPVTGEYSTLRVDGSCVFITENQFVGEPSLSAQDLSAEYPVGLVDFEVQCASPGDSTNVTIYYTEQYDTSNWLYKKFDGTGEMYSDISPLVTFGAGVVGSTTVTTVSYSVTDGDSVTDEDKVADGVINDPSGPAIKVSSGGSPTKRVCRDPEALNYEKFGKSSPNKCIYEDSSDLTKLNAGFEIESETNENIQEVDPDSSVCAPYLSETIALNRNNNSEEVIKLQEFLYDHEGEELTIDGIYNQDDFEAVKRFQEKYSSSVLDIWGLSEATGYVGITTKMKINSFNCSKSLTCPLFTEYNSRKQNTNTAEVQRTKVFMSELGFYNGEINTTWDNGIYQSMIDFQETFKTTMLAPWGLTKGTGYKYKTTNKFMNELVGCTTADLQLENGVTVSY